MRSLRARMIAGAVLGTLLVLAASGVALYTIVRAHLYTQLDAALVPLAEAASQALREEAGRRHVQGVPPFDPWTPSWAAPDLIHAFAVVDGPPLDSSGAEGRALLADEIDSDALGVARTVELESGLRARAVRIRFPGRPPDPPRGGRRDRGGFDDGPGFDRRPPPRLGDLPREDRPPPRGERPPRDGGPPRHDGPPRHGERPPRREDVPTADLELVVARDLDEVDSTLAELARLLFATGGIAVLASSVILALVARRTLRPLDRVGRELASLKPADLSQRIDARGLPTELTPIVDEINDALARLHAGFEREQDFASSAAHELRTPLAGLRATLELALRKERSAQEWSQSGEGALSIVIELQRLVESLLAIARDAPRELVREEVAPLAAFEEAWSSAREIADARDVTIELAGDRDVRLTTDPTLLRRIAANVLENAAQYADSSSVVRVSVEATANGVELRIENAASDAPPEVAERAFEPFWRADRARGGLRRNAGLGLALCEQLATELGGSIDAELVQGRFRLRLTLPNAGSRA